MNEPTHRSFLVVDVENSGDLGNIELETMRSTLYRILDEASTCVEGVVAKEDRGDGVMLVCDLSVLDVLDQLVGGLLGGVRMHNNTVDPPDWLRVRIAVHEGYVHMDEHGWMSDALTTTFRMNGARVVKDTLKHASRAHGVVVVSDVVYQGVVRHNYRATVTSAEYRNAVISTKEGNISGWIRVPGYSVPPLPSSAAAPAGADRGEPEAGVIGSDAITANIVVGRDVRAHRIVGRDYFGGSA